MATALLLTSLVMRTFPALRQRCGKEAAAGAILRSWLLFPHTFYEEDNDLKIFRNRTVIGVLCILLALIICFGVTPLFSRSASEKRRSSV